MASSISKDKFVINIEQPQFETAKETVQPPNRDYPRESVACVITTCALEVLVPR